MLNTEELTRTALYTRLYPPLPHTSPQYILLTHYLKFQKKKLSVKPGKCHLGKVFTTDFNRFPCPIFASGPEQYFSASLTNTTDAYSCNSQ